MIGVLYEHPQWFVPLFGELDRRGLPYRHILADALRYDPGAAAAPCGLVVNRMSPSAYWFKPLRTSSISHLSSSPTLAGAAR
jgi:hypothetical protein